MARPSPAWTPPLRDGVSASRVVVSAGPWATLAAFLSQRLRGATDWPARLARGDVLDAQGRPLAVDAPCRPGALLWYWRNPAPEPRVPFEITVLHQCAQLVVVDKPHFLPVTPGGRHLQQTVLVRLQRLLGMPNLAPMHRLDRETAGVLAFTVQPAQRHAFAALLRQHQAHKVYEAIAPWRADLALPLVCQHRLAQRPGSFMQMQVVPGAPNAETLIELVRHITPGAAAWDQPDSPASASLPSSLALYRLTPRTGQRHQLRVQLDALGLPIVGDRIYPRLWPEPAPDAAPDYHQPLQLLARSLAFVDPLTGEPRCFTSQRRLQLDSAG